MSKDIDSLLLEALDKPERCPFGCKDACKAKEHGCASECPALPWQPTDQLGQVEPTNIRERWNIERDGNDLLVCFNNHEKGDKCEYERFVPAASRAQHGQGEAVYQAEFDGGWHDIAEADLWKYRAPHWPDCVIRTLYTAPQPLPDREPLSDEQERALCEGYCNAAEQEYFAARPQLDSRTNRRIFYAGHRKAWIEWEAAHGIKKGG